MLSSVKQFNQEQLEQLKKLLEYNAAEQDFSIQNKLYKELITKYSDLSRELKEKIAEVTRLSQTDQLTQCYNRLKFHEELQKEFERAKRYKQSFSIILFDIDHFKQVNDTYGHDVGDITLVTLAKTVKKQIRKTDIFARWGGEEFIILTPHTNIKQAAKLAEKLRRTIENKQIDKVGNITCSFGVSEYADDFTDDRLFQKVDQALYKAKKGGRNRVELSTNSFKQTGNPS